MYRHYTAIIEIGGKEQARLRSTSMTNIREWIERQRKLYAHKLKPGKDWQIYYQTESQPSPKKRDFNIRRKDLSEQEKTVNKYLND
jgi:hypothetical protein